MAQGSMKARLGVTFALLMAPTAASAQVVATLKPLYADVRGFIVKSAEQMPAEAYSFKPVDGVRTFGQIIGHLANENFLMCATAKGEKRTMVQDFEKNTEKAALVKAIKDAMAYCDPIYAMPDKRFKGSAELFGQKMPRLEILGGNVTHNWEHYGNIITYLRIKGMVPPSSQPPGQ